MKRPLASLVLAIGLSGTAQAETPEITEEHCVALHRYAENVMRVRQFEFPLPRVIELAEGNLLRELIARAAYQRPRYTSTESQELAIQEFANEAYMDCIDRM